MFKVEEKQLSEELSGVYSLVSFGKPYIYQNLGDFKRMRGYFI
tara:strand:+ start:1711 stop:1839 length:129 start_codon:yes stop_codon:yes gene_type:complete